LFYKHRMDPLVFTTGYCLAKMPVSGWLTKN